MKASVFNLLKKYGFVLVLVLLTILALIDGLRQRKLVQSLEQEKHTLHETLVAVTAESERLQRTIDSQENKEQVVVETITERKDGTRVIKRKSETKQQNTVKQVETAETKTESKVDLDKVSETERKVSTLTFTEPAKPNRLGLDVGLGVRSSLDFELGIELQASYELKYRLAPVVGVEFTPTFTKPKNVYLGVEVRL